MVKRKLEDLNLLDVYIEENVTNESENDITVYDVEPDKNTKDINIMPQRVRFYHAKIDARSLKSGESYRMLKKVIVIMITPYDPFGLNHMIYTIRNKCEEIPNMPYDDGARTVFLYTRGTEGNPPEELKQFLHYMEHTTEENAITDNLHSIHQMVNLVKQDEEVSLQYMKIFEREEMLIQQGIEQGIEQGIQQGRKAEQDNTELERQRAEKEKARADQLEKELQHLKEKLKESRFCEILFCSTLSVSDTPLQKALPLSSLQSHRQPAPPGILPSSCQQRNSAEYRSAVSAE